MYVLLVKLQVKPGHMDAYMKSMLDDARSSVRDEPGCLRFDVMRDENKPNTIYLFEVYKDKAAFDAHTRAPHFTNHRDTVKDWNAAPAEVRWGISVFPSEKAWKKQTL